MTSKLSVLGIIAFQVLVAIIINFGSLSSNLDCLGLNVFSLKHLHEKSFNKPIKDLEGGAFFKETFKNPTPYDNIKDPHTAPESYIPRLEVSCYVYDPDHLNIVIRDADKLRYEIPYEDPYPHPKNPKFMNIEESNFEFEFKSDPFDFIVRRKSTKEVIFKLTDRLVYTDLYLEFSFYTPTREIYGLGMRVSPLQFRPGTYTLFLLDRAGIIDYGTAGLNGQGHHSMYLMKEKTGNYHIFFLRNVAFGEVTIYEGNKIRWQLTGGVLDFNFFLGTTPESVVDKYHRYLDGWSMPGFWHLGYHQNKWNGYKDINALRTVLEGFESHKIPLETLWTDTEHMKDNNNFSIDEVRFPLDEVRELYAKYKKRWIPLFNAFLSTPFIPPLSEYPNIESLYMKDSLGELCDGRFLWGKVIFMDFFNPICEPFWDKMIWETDKKWDLSGLWIDANEISNLEKRENPPSKLKDPNRKYYKLPFYPGGGVNLYDLQVVNLDCIHYNGQEEFDARTWNALFQSKYSYESLRKKFPYPFVLGRATMMGGGKYGATWVPDIWSTWESLKASTAGILNYGIFGYAMAGVDICGFVSEYRVDPEVCARWHQVATFYPFARNSHVVDWNNRNNYQEPYLFTGETFNTIHSHIKLRYSILKYYYTLFFTKETQAEERKIGALLRPLFYDYHDEATLPPYGHDVHETQFLLDEAIMVATLIYPKMTFIDVYFPNRRWYDLRNYEEVSMRGGFKTISGALTETIPYFLKGGNILLKQDVEGVMRTEDLSNTFTIIAGLNDPTQNAESIQSFAEGKILAAASYDEHYVYDHCTKQNCILSINVTYNYQDGKSSLILKAKEEVKDSVIDAVQVNEIIVMGVPKGFMKEIKSVKLEGNNEINIDLKFSANGNIHLKFSDLDVEDETMHKFIFS